MMKKKSNGFAIVVDKASFSYKSIKAVDRLSLRVPKGITFGLLGPNGAGKTTLIRLLVGLSRPQSGTVRILGRPLSRRLSHRIGYMPQLHSLYSELTVSQNVDFFAQIYGLKDKARRHKRVEEVIRLVGLWQRRNDSVLKLSGGMKQRASLACAIVHYPRVLFLDEPTVGLDPGLRVTFWNYFAALTKRGVTLIISSHTMDDAAHCDRLALMRRGKIIAQGTPNQLRQATGDPEATLEDAFLYFTRHIAVRNHVK
jgi:ABC-2 type transport system ATP-binding protein